MNIIRILWQKGINYIRLYNQRENRELRRIEKIKRRNPFNTNILGAEWKCGDSASFIGQYNEIIKKEIYRFNTQDKCPYIVDCGANIGVSVFYFKTKYPAAEIVAFEPDPTVFTLLVENLQGLNLSNLLLINKGVWNVDGNVKFSGKGDDAGRIVEGSLGDHDYIDIEVVRLRPYLQRKVHLLKIDIEGAEFEVLEDISDLLLNVERIFIEYHSKINEEQKLHNILEILRKNGFRYFLEQTTLYNSNPFINISVSDKLDNLLNIYGYRTH